MWHRGLEETYKGETHFGKRRGLGRNGGTIGCGNISGNAILGNPNLFQKDSRTVRLDRMFIGMEKEKNKMKKDEQSGRSYCMAGNVETYILFIDLGQGLLLKSRCSVIVDGGGSGVESRTLVVDDGGADVGRGR